GRTGHRVALLGRGIGSSVRGILGRAWAAVSGGRAGGRGESAGNLSWPLVVLGDRLAAVAGAQGTEGRGLDVVRQEFHRPVAEEEVRSPGVLRAEADLPLGVH